MPPSHPLTRGRWPSSRTLGWHAVDAAASGALGIAGRGSACERSLRGRRTTLWRTAKTCGPDFKPYVFLRRTDKTRKDQRLRRSWLKKKKPAQMRRAPIGPRPFVSASERHFRSSLGSGHRHARSACLKSATADGNYISRGTIRRALLREDR